MEWFPKATQQSSAGGTQHPWHSPGQTEPWAVLLQQALARLMKQLPNETGHLIRIYIKEKKKPSQKSEDCTLVSLYQQLISSSAETKEGTKLFQTAAFQTTKFIS